VGSGGAAPGGLAWVDGALRPAGSPALPADGGAFAGGPGCYTTARWRCGRVRFAAAHAARLVRDARALGLGALDPALVERALAELGRAAFGDAGEGVVRVQAGRDAGGGVHLVATARALGPEPAGWRAVRSPVVHPGPGAWPGAKRSDHPALARARALAEAAGADEALLFDAAGRLVEGARTTPFVVLSDGAPVTPPAARGGVAGVARALLLARVPEVRERDVDAGDLAGARELVLANAVRGAAAAVTLDGAPLCGGRPGPWRARLAAALDDADAEDAGRGERGC